ncbi:acyl CoA:acetate/3-ketoacid CoA transferase alpha subunit [Bradyrhizobium sp. USDA 4518]
MLAWCHEAFLLGCISHLYRNIAARGPGVISKVGLKTFVDPRLEDDKLNEKTTEDLVELMRINDEEWLRYKSFPINVALLRGTTADPAGNITMEREALTLDNLAMAMAAKNSRGFVIVQVERIAASNSLNPREVQIPGILVDCVVADAIHAAGDSFCLQKLKLEPACDPDGMLVRVFLNESLGNRQSRGLEGNGFFPIKRTGPALRRNVSNCSDRSRHSFTAAGQSSKHTRELLPRTKKLCRRRRAWPATKMEVRRVLGPLKHLQAETALSGLPRNRLRTGRSGGPGHRHLYRRRDRHVRR